MELYYGIILQNYITGSYYGIILQNDIMELYYGITFTKRIHGMPGTSPKPPGIPGIPCARPWDAQRGAQDFRPLPWEPWGRPWDPRARPWDPPGTSPRPPGNAPGIPRNLQRPLMDHKNNHMSTNIQRQKLSIAVFKPAYQGPSHEALDRAVSSIKNAPNQ